MRDVSDVMADIALSGLEPHQLALVMELAASVAASARGGGVEPAPKSTSADRMARLRERRRLSENASQECVTKRHKASHVTPKPSQTVTKRHITSQSVTCDGSDAAIEAVAEVIHKKDRPLSPPAPPTNPHPKKITHARTRERPPSHVTERDRTGSAVGGRLGERGSVADGRSGASSGGTVLAERPDLLPGGAGQLGCVSADRVEAGAEFRSALERTVEADRFRSWLEPCRFEVLSGVVTVVAQSKFSADWIRNHLFGEILPVARRVFGAGASVEVVVDG